MQALEHKKFSIMARYTMLKKFVNLKWLLLSLIVIAADQLSKYVVAVQVMLNEERRITSFFNIFLIHNYGGAFSFLNNPAGGQAWLFSGLAIGISVGMVLWMLFSSSGQNFLLMTLSLIIGGAVGNLIDRLQYGYVVDFLDFHLNNFHWPTFNAADTAISLGAFFLLLIFLKKT